MLPNDTARQGQVSQRPLLPAAILYVSQDAIPPELPNCVIRYLPIVVIDSGKARDSIYLPELANLRGFQF